MITKKMMALLTGSESADSLVAELVARSRDFAEDYRRFEDAIDYFKNALPKDAAPSVEDLQDAIRKQIMSLVVFAGDLGFRANADHFANPVARTFMDVDPDVYLREDVAMALPEYTAAQKIIDNFRNRLSPEQTEPFESVAVYIIHLKTIVPKIAHYEGFMLGNALLRYVIPGYQPDPQLTVRYRAMCKAWFTV